MRASTAKTSAPRRRKAPASKPRFQAPEPLIDRPEQPQAKPADKQTAKAPAKAAAKPAVRKTPPSNLEPGRPTEHNGIQVVREELRRNLPTNAPFKISKLHLEDGTTAFACRDCLFTGDTNVDVQRHRNAEHGARFGKRTPKVVFAKDNQLDDIILPPRGERPAPTNPMEMTLAEFLAVAPSYAAMADLIDRVEQERDAALAKIVEMQQMVKDAKHAIAVYPTLQSEVVDLRLMVRNAGTYEELKAEVLHLRTWKKKITQRLESLGFVFADEDNTTKEQ